MKKDLNIQQRLAVSVLYTGTLLTLIFIFTRSFNFLTDSSPYNLIFVSAALLLVFGKYLTEPFFTKPVDTITNLTAILLALLAVKDRSAFIAYDEFLWVTVGLLGLALISILFSKKGKPVWLDRLQKVIYLIVTTLGSSKWVFSVMYLLVLLSFFTQRPAEFWILLTFFIFVITQFAYEDLVRYMTKIFTRLQQGDTATLLGTAIGKENPFLFKVEVESSRAGSSAARVGKLVYIQAESKRGLLGVVANEKSLIHGTWLTVCLLSDGSRAFCYDFKAEKIVKTNDLFSPNNNVYSIDVAELGEEARREVESNEIYKNTSNIIGYVAPGSNINRIKFEVLPEMTDKSAAISEGAIVHTRINNDACLYQVIDGQTDEETLEKHDSSGYTVGAAQKLGRYDQSARELNVVKWLPNIYSPVYLSTMRSAKKEPVSIGTLPGTKLAIDIKELDSLITHNTAILGILGIGKSMLTFELVQKVLQNTTAKVICIDITNEYRSKLKDYTADAIDHDEETSFNSIDGKFDYIHTDGSKQDFSKSGNIAEYRDEIRKDLMQFFFGTDAIPDDKLMNGTGRIKIFNPDYHKVSKGEKVGFNVITTELTQAEKVRIITEEAFRILMQMGVSPDLRARVLFVFEEAHSLIPEWNSTANEGDKTAVNGTAKVILQGRKYGLGSFVVTQRTANISKSILNQCNTIFALRVFDDTGKQFLENYVGADYANALPTLEERHAIAVGKALRLKQPVIIQLNDRSDVVINQ